MSASNPSSSAAVDFFDHHSENEEADLHLILEGQDLVCVGGWFGKTNPQVVISSSQAKGGGNSTWKSYFKSEIISNISESSNTRWKTMIIPINELCGSTTNNQSHPIRIAVQSIDEYSGATTPMGYFDTTLQDILKVAGDPSKMASLTDDAGQPYGSLIVRHARIKKKHPKKGAQRRRRSSASSIKSYQKRKHSSNNAVAATSTGAPLPTIQQPLLHHQDEEGPVASTSTTIIPKTLLDNVETAVLTLTLEADLINMGGSSNLSTLVESVAGGSVGGAGDEGENDDNFSVLGSLWGGGTQATRKKGGGGGDDADDFTVQTEDWLRTTTAHLGNLLGTTNPYYTISSITTTTTSNTTSNTVPTTIDEDGSVSLSSNWTQQQQFQQMVYKSEPIFDCVTPIWKPAIIPLFLLCGDEGDLKRKFRISIYSQRDDIVGLGATAKPTRMGYFDCSILQLKRAANSPSGDQHVFVPANKDGTKRFGTVRVLEATLPDELDDISVASNDDSVWGHDSVISEITTGDLGLLTQHPLWGKAGDNIIHYNNNENNKPTATARPQRNTSEGLNSTTATTPTTVRAAAANDHQINVDDNDDQVSLNSMFKNAMIGISGGGDGRSTTNKQDDGSKATSSMFGFATDMMEAVTSSLLPTATTTTAETATTLAEEVEKEQGRKERMAPLQEIAVRSRPGERSTTVGSEEEIIARGIKEEEKTKADPPRDKTTKDYVSTIMSSEVRLSRIQPQLSTTTTRPPKLTTPGTSSSSMPLAATGTAAQQRQPSGGVFRNDVYNDDANSFGDLQIGPSGTFSALSCLSDLNDDHYVDTIKKARKGDDDFGIVVSAASIPHAESASRTVKSDDDLLKEIYETRDASSATAGGVNGGVSAASLLIRRTRSMNAHVPLETSPDLAIQRTTSDDSDLLQQFMQNLEGLEGPEKKVVNLELNKENEVEDGLPKRNGNDPSKDDIGSNIVTSADMQTRLERPKVKAHKSLPKRWERNELTPGNNTDNDDLATTFNNSLLEQITELKAQLLEKDTMLIEAKEKAKICSSKSYELEAKLAQKDSICQEVETALVEANAMVASREAKLAAALAAAKSTDQRMRSDALKIDTMAEENEGLVEEMMRLKALANEATMKKNEVEDIVARYEEEKRQHLQKEESWVEEKTKMLEKVAQLEVSIDSSHGRIQDLKIQLENVGGEKNSLESELEQARLESLATIEALRQELADAVEAERLNGAERINNQAGRIDVDRPMEVLDQQALDARIAEKSTLARRELESMLVEAENQIQLRQEQARGDAVTIETLSNQIENLKGQMATLKGQSSINTNSTTETKSLLQLKEEKATLEKSLEDADEVTRRYKNDLADADKKTLLLTESVKARERLVEKSQEEIMALRKQKEKYLLEKHEWEQKLQEANTRVSDNINEALKATLTQAGAKVKMYEEKSAMDDVKITELSSQNVGMRERLEQLEKMLEEKSRALLRFGAALESKDTLIEKLQFETSVVRGKLEEATGDKETALSACKMMESELKDHREMKATAAALEDEVKALRQKVPLLEMDAQHRELEQSKERERASILQASLEGKESEMKRQREMIETLKRSRRASTAVDVTSADQEKLKQMERERDKALKNSKKLEKRVSVLQQDLDGAQFARNVYEGYWKDANTRMEQLKEIAEESPAAEGLPSSSKKSIRKSIKKPPSEKSVASAGGKMDRKSKRTSTKTADLVSLASNKTGRTKRSSSAKRPSSVLAGKASSSMGVPTTVETKTVDKKSASNSKKERGDRRDSTTKDKRASLGNKNKSRESLAPRKDSDSTGRERSKSDKSKRDSSAGSKKTKKEDGGERDNKRPGEARARSSLRRSLAESKAKEPRSKTKPKRAKDSDQDDDFDLR